MPCQYSLPTISCIISNMLIFCDVLVNLVIKIQCTNYINKQGKKDL